MARMSTSQYAFHPQLEVMIHQGCCRSCLYISRATSRAAFRASAPGYPANVPRTVESRRSRRAPATCDRLPVRSRSDALTVLRRAQPARARAMHMQSDYLVSPTPRATAAAIVITVMNIWPRPVVQVWVLGGSGEGNPRVG